MSVPDYIQEAIEKMKVTYILEFVSTVIHDDEVTLFVKTLIKNGCPADALINAAMATIKRREEKRGKTSASEGRPLSDDEKERLKNLLGDDLKGFLYGED